MIRRPTRPAGIRRGTNPAGTNPGECESDRPGADGAELFHAESGLGLGLGLARIRFAGQSGIEYTAARSQHPGGAAATPTAPGTSSTSAAASAGGAGRSGMGGMGSPGSRGGQYGESSHKIPDHLITRQNTEEPLGDIPPNVPGGVIGGEPG